MGETRRASEGPRESGGDPRGQRDAARSPRGGDRESVPAGRGANARGRKGAQGDQRARARRGQGRKENPGNRGAVGDAEQGQGRGSRARDRGQPRAPPGPSPGDREADQGSRWFARFHEGSQRSPRTSRTRTRSGSNPGKGGPRIGSGPIQHSREGPQRLTAEPREGGAHPGVRPGRGEGLPPPTSGSGKGKTSRTHQGAKRRRRR